MKELLYKAKHYSNKLLRLARRPKDLIRFYSIAFILLFALTSSYAQVYPTFSISESGGTIHVSSYGAFPDDGIDDEDQINQAINAAGPNMVVKFDAGVYTLRAPDSRFTSLATGHILISGKNNITLEGTENNGIPTTHIERILEYPSAVSPPSILWGRWNDGVKVKNMTFDNKNYHMAAGEVIAINSSSVTVEVLDGYPVPNSCPTTAANVWTWDGQSNTSEKLKVGKPSLTFASSGGNFVKGTGRQMTLNANFSQHVSVGDYISWHYGTPSIGTVNFRVNKRVWVENVHIYNGLRSMLFFAFDEDIYVKDVELRPKSGRFASGPRDGIHSSRNTGEYIVDNLYVKGTRLDGFVSAGTAGRVSSIINNTTFRFTSDASLEGGKSFGSNLGDGNGGFSDGMVCLPEPIHFFDSNGERHIVGVQSVTYIGPATVYEVVTTEPIPSFVQPNTVMSPEGLSPDTVIVENSTFEGIAGSGQVMFCNSSLAINNTYDNLMYAAIRFGANPRRNHAGLNHTVTTSNFVDCGWVINLDNPADEGDEYGYINSFNANTQGFNNMDVGNILIENNSFTSNHPSTGTDAGRAGIILDEAYDITIQNNTFSGITVETQLRDVYGSVLINGEMALTGTYRLKNQQYGNFLRGFDPNETNTSSDHANVTQEDLNTVDSTKQQWKFSLVGSQQGYFNIKNIFSNRVLRAYDVNNTPNVGDDVPVTVHSIQNWGSMMWKPIPIPGETNTYFLKSLSGGYFLKGASTNSSYATLETDSTTAGTKWILFDITGSLPDNSTTTSNIIYPSMDAYVKGGADANSNFGASSRLVVKESSNALYDRMSFLQFDLGTISNPVTNAKIRLKVETEDIGASHNLHLVSDDSWTESGITWNNQPGNSSLISTEVVPAVDGWIEFDVTAVVNNETDGFLSVRISDANTAEDYILYHSSEATNLEDRPQLVYELSAAQSLVPFEDTFGKGGANSSSNYGSQSTIEVKESSNSNYDRKGYVKFDISSVSGTVSDAKLRLKVQTRDASTNHELWLVTVDTWTESGLNWTNQPSGSTLIGSQAIPASGNWVEFDVTSILNNETDPLLSFQLVNTNENEALVRYHSSEATAMEDRPQLAFTSSSNSSRMDNMETILSIGEGDPQSEIFKFYPNPAEDYIILDGAIKDSHFTLSNLSGKKIMEIRLTEDINRIDISSIPKGTYLLTLRTKDGMTSYMEIVK